MVQRTASYLGNTYKWENCPTDLAEGRENPDTAVRNSPYPVEGLSRNTIFSGIELEALSLRQVKDLLLLIVPGDIFTYGPSAHIGVIDKLDYASIESAASRDVALKAITILESTYDGAVCYVQNTRSLWEILNKDAWSVARLTNE